MPLSVEVKTRLSVSGISTLVNKRAALTKESVSTLWTSIALRLSYLALTIKMCASYLPRMVKRFTIYPMLMMRKSVVPSSAPVRNSWLPQGLTILLKSGTLVRGKNYSHHSKMRSIAALVPTLR
jgi:hypothetical protein